MRTQGSLGKAVFLRVSLDELQKRYAPGAMIDISIESHGTNFGVDRNACPRVKTVIFGTENQSAPAPAAVSVPAAPHVFGLNINAENEAESSAPAGRVLALHELED